MMQHAIRIFNNNSVVYLDVIKYSDGAQHHAPPHQDKIPYGTDFFVLSFGEPRKFQIINSENEVVWSKYAIINLELFLLRQARIAAAPQARIAFFSSSPATALGIFIFWRQKS